MSLLAPFFRAPSDTPPILCHAAPLSVVMHDLRALAIAVPSSPLRSITCALLEAEETFTTPQCLYFLEAIFALIREASCTSSFGVFPTEVTSQWLITGRTVMDLTVSIHNLECLPLGLPQSIQLN